MSQSVRSFGKSILSTWRSAAVALVAWVSIVVCLDPAGSYPSMPQGPGLTIDEIFNVEQGVYLVESARGLGWYNLIPGTSVEAFRPENGCNPDHPPLGRYWLGVHHQLAWWIAPPDQPDGPFVTACARTGSATAFALTVWLIGAYVGFAVNTAGSGSEQRRFQRWQGPLACVALVLMPRVYGHAHLAALETMTNLTCTAAVLAVAAWWSGPEVPTGRVAFLAGIVMGLALLTKVQAVLIPLPVIAWALLRWRQKGIVPLLIWGITANVIFLMWPYLWLDPVGHLLEYLGRTTNRVTLYCYYFGTRYADKEVPWHYPFVMFAITVPIGLHLLGLWGVKSDLVVSKTAPPATRDNAWRTGLLLGCGLFPLLVFAAPGVAVYDGERLFLTVFPLWTPLIASGAVAAMRLVSSRIGVGLTQATVCLLIAAQLASNWQSHPSYLSHYNVAVGGLAGAEKLGLEMNYWSDGITRELLKEAAADANAYGAIDVRPSLHQFQRDDLMQQSPILRKQRVPAGSEAEKRTLQFAFRRRADLSDDEFFKYDHLTKKRLAGYRSEQ
jgi:hypothetical protein